MEAIKQELEEMKYNAKDTSNEDDLMESNYKGDSDELSNSLKFQFMLQCYNILYAQFSF